MITWYKSGKSVLQLEHECERVYVDEWTSFADEMLCFRPSFESQLIEDYGMDAVFVSYPYCKGYEIMQLPDYNKVDWDSNGYITSRNGIRYKLVEVFLKGGDDSIIFAIRGDGNLL